MVLCTYGLENTAFYVLLLGSHSALPLMKGSDKSCSREA